jgi:hypothetical protein
MDDMDISGSNLPKGLLVHFLPNRWLGGYNNMEKAYYGTHNESFTTLLSLV